MKMRFSRLTRSECARVARALQSYLDGEVDPPTAAMVTAHLEICRRCGLQAQTYQAIKTAIATTGQADVDQAALGRLHAFAAGLDASGNEGDR